MPWEKPTLDELVSQRSGDLSNRLLEGNKLRANSALSVIAKMQAGGEYNLYAFIAWGFRQCFPDTAESEYLEEWGRVWGVWRKAAVSSTGMVMATGTPGSAVMDLSVAVAAGGARYVLAGGTLGEDGTAVFGATAEVPGASGNLAAGAKINLASPAIGVAPDLEVVEALAGGADVETDRDLRARVIKLIQSPPHGGNKADYEVWALEVEGVGNALCIPTMRGLGTVGVAVWGGPESPELDGNTIARVFAHILEKCPVTAGPGLYVYTPEPYPVNFTVRVVPDTPQVRENVRKELGDTFQADALPGQRIPLSHLREAISLAAGEYDHELLAPTADVLPTVDALPIIGEVVFV
jgi:uncharacterized phage protein gp47/JayE